MALGRQFPLFRQTIAHHLIDDTCIANAAYAFSTGLAEVIPVLDVPLNLTDMIVLTKSQAFLAYKLGLTLGFSVNWQDYVTEFGSVVGSGFLWRQVARQLIGLIPVWGIVPKVAIAYAGTFVVGNAVLQWYTTGRHISRQQLQVLYLEAFQQGKLMARRLVDKVPRPNLKWGKKKPAAPALASGKPAAKPHPMLNWRKSKALPPAGQICPQCAKTNAPDAIYCQYCGQIITQANPREDEPS
jgi:uncharacterized protein (DUF697 family)